MPIYTFYNKKTKKEYDDMMSISEMESYLSKNKHISHKLYTMHLSEEYKKKRNSKMLRLN